MVCGIAPNIASSASGAPQPGVLEAVAQEVQRRGGGLESPPVLVGAHVLGGHGPAESVDRGRLAAGVIGIEDVTHRLTGEVPVDVPRLDGAGLAVDDRPGNAFEPHGRPVVPHTGVAPVVDSAAPVGGGVPVLSHGVGEGLRRVSSDGDVVVVRPAADGAFGTSGELGDGPGAAELGDLVTDVRRRRPRSGQATPYQIGDRSGRTPADHHWSPSFGTRGRSPASLPAASTRPISSLMGALRLILNCPSPSPSRSGAGNTAAGSGSSDR